MYVTAIRFRPISEEYRKAGVDLITSSIPMKTPFFAKIKSCNYLPNVLIKMEAIEAGCQYAVALDENGFLAEGSIENIGVLNAEEILKFPEFEMTLSGTTAKRVFHLASVLVEENVIRDVKFARISPSEAYQAREIFLTGTSLDILPVVNYDRRSIGSGVPGPVYSRLLSLLRKDMTENRDLLTELDWGDAK
jgi:branched-chain amino acid aminotransferase